MKLLFLATAISVALSPSVFADDLQASIDTNAAGIAKNLTEINTTNTLLVDGFADAKSINRKLDKVTEDNGQIRTWAAAHTNESVKQTQRLDALKVKVDENVKSIKASTDNFTTVKSNSAAIAANTIAAGDNSAAIINNKARTDALSSTLASSSASTNALIAKNKSDAESYISNITQSVAKDSMRIDNLVAGNTNAINKNDAHLASLITDNSNKIDSNVTAIGQNKADADSLISGNTHAIAKVKTDMAATVNGINSTISQNKASVDAAVSGNTDAIANNKAAISQLNNEDAIVTARTEKNSLLIKQRQHAVDVTNAHIGGLEKSEAIRFAKDERVIASNKVAIDSNAKNAATAMTNSTIAVNKVGIALTHADHSVKVADESLAQSKLVAKTAASADSHATSALNVANHAEARSVVADKHATEAVSVANHSLAQSTDNGNRIQEARKDITQNVEAIATNHNSISDNSRGVKQNAQDIYAVNKRVDNNFFAIKNLQEEIDNLDTKIDASYAQSGAMSALMEPHGVGHASFSMGTAHHGNANALALGFGMRLDNNFSIKAGGAFDDVTSQPTVFFGAGVEW